MFVWRISREKDEEIKSTVAFASTINSSKNAVNITKFIFRIILFTGCYKAQALLLVSCIYGGLSEYFKVELLYSLWYMRIIHTVLTTDRMLRVLSWVIFGIRIGAPDLKWLPRIGQPGGQIWSFLFPSHLRHHEVTITDCFESCWNVRKTNWD